jgi:putative oxidoreductase
MSLIAAVIGRLLIALLFIVSGLGKIMDPAPAGQMMQSVNLPANLALPVGVFELVAGALLAVGLMTRLVALLLAAFVALTIFFFHHDFGTQQGMSTVLMHLALLGGLLMTFAYGQVRGTFDYMRERRRTYDAELRAARAEGRAEGATAAPHTVVHDAPATVIHETPRTVVADTPHTVVTDVDRDGVPEVRQKRRWF